jgi:UDP-N-acetylmuramate: L-alanyl-gamma-D-glutamyl-meso-diaminopimelate ligase
MMHIHILGICGTFMGGLAVLARAAGHRVTGCDANVYPPMSTQLAAQSITLIQGYGEEQVDLAPDVYVVGNVVTRGNPLMEAILAQGLPCTSGPQWLADHVLQGRWVLGVAGTHGKTTTSALLAWILEDAGLNPSFLIGGVPQNFGVSARLTDSPFFVIEADEYDTAFFDKRSKFIHYKPRTVVLNNLEFDHADIFTDLTAIETQFHHLVRTLPNNGLIVAQAGLSALDRVLARGAWTPLARFGADGEWQVTAADATGFSVLHHGQTEGRVEWALLGEHNRMNALAAIIAARHVGVSVAHAISALSRFQNVRRRMELRGVVAEVAVYDDFAHHPTAIATTLAGLRQRVGSARIIAVIEPRSNTMKLGVMKQALAESLMNADQVYCYSGGIDWDVAAALQPLGTRVTVIATVSALVEALVQNARAGDQVLVMSNGSFGGIHEQLLARLARIAPSAD